VHDDLRTPSLENPRGSFVTECGEVGSDEVQSKFVYHRGSEKELSGAKSSPWSADQAPGWVCDACRVRVRERT